jgi:hypothetical protein
LYVKAVFADAVAEIFLLAVAAHVLERKDADAEVASYPSLAFGVGVGGAGERPDAAQELSPAGRVGVSVPCAELGALDLVEGQRRDMPIEGCLDQRAHRSCGICLGAHPLRLRRLDRPEDDDRLCGVQPFLDDLGIGAVRRQLVIAPDLVSARAQALRDARRFQFIRPSIGEEDICHPGFCPINPLIP